MLTLALISLLTGRSLIPRLSMTGEITLRGRVTAVGGIREKVIAALRAGIRQGILPEENRKDVEEISREIKNGLEIVLVKTMEEVRTRAFAQARE